MNLLRYPERFVVAARCYYRAPCLMMRISHDANPADRAATKRARRRIVGRLIDEALRRPPK